MAPQLPARTVEGAQAAWEVVTAAWDATMERVASLPEPMLHERVDGEWSFVETLRHLVFATDAWVRRAILAEPQPYHPLGLPPDPDPGERPVDVRPWGIDVEANPSFAEVLAARLDRTATVQRVIDELTPAEYSRICAQHPAPGFPPVTRFPVSLGLDVVLGEEWAHHGFAVRDLDTLTA
jgi:hypothetical protein